MNKEAVQELLADRLHEVRFLEGTGIAVGKYLYNQAIVGIYFIDFSGNPLSDDLRDFQEKYISSEYYNTPGHLQWNYYLIFLRDSYQEDIKLLIEKDDIYTRKYVFTTNELKDYFDYQKSDKTVDVDIINVWKEKLKEVDLDEVYSNTPYTQAIPRYLAGEAIKDTESEQQVSNSNQNLTIQKISTLKLQDNYRKYPIERNFILGQVNLIKGVNGSGKTSLLESIELIVTGKSYRDPSFSEEANCIEATYNGSNIGDSYTPANNSKYRERDIAWYSSAYKSGNELYRTFNKYNFYDSDAAYNLSYNSDIGSLSKYLSSIALGPEFSRIQDRLQGFNERLTKENSNRKRVIDDEKGRSIMANRTIEMIKISSNPIELFKSFISLATEFKWKRELPQKIDDSFVKFEEDHQAADSYINSLNQLLVTIKLRNLKAWKDELLKIKNALEKCDKSKENIETIRRLINEGKETQAKLHERSEILNSAKRYFDDERSFKLEGLDEKIDSLSSEIKKSIRVAEYSQKIVDQNILSVEQEFSVYKKEETDHYQELQEKKRKLKNQIEELTSNLDKLQGIISEIKAQGKQYVTINAKADSCPLCETEYPYHELSERISKVANDLSEAVAIKELNEQLIGVDGELGKINAVNKDIEMVEKSISNIKTESEYSSLTLKEIGSLISENKATYEKNISEQNKLSLLKQELSDKNYDEYSFNEIKKSIENIFTNFKFVYSQKTVYEEASNALNKELLENSDKLDKSKEDLIQIENAQTAIIKEVAPSVNYLDYEREFKYRIELLEKGISYFSELSTFINYLDTDDLSDIQLKIDRLFNTYIEIRKAQTDQKELLLANQIIAEADKKIKQLMPECEMLDRGLAVINDILTNYNESSVLGDFIKNNEKEIQGIFQNIHAPKEFSKIVFSSETNSVLLKRRDNEAEIPIYKISTGQRSALALSIFIALNKKLKHGPHIILFDDPVTYTDDLNILSFLDYLRELVINEGRQLVFATANQKLAGLFEKKFKFLGDAEFKIFPFER